MTVAWLSGSWSKLQRQRRQCWYVDTSVELRKRLEMADTLPSCTTLMRMAGLLVDDNSWQDNGTVATEGGEGGDVAKR